MVLSGDGRSTVPEAVSEAVSKTQRSDDNFISLGYACCDLSFNPEVEIFVMLVSVLTCRFSNRSAPFVLGKRRFRF